MNSFLPWRRRLRHSYPVDFVVAGSPADSDFLIAGVGGGNTLRVKVSAVRGSLEGPPSAVAEIIVPAGGTLSAPTGLQLQAGQMNSIIATWNAVTDATNYEVEKQLVRRQDLI